MKIQEGVIKFHAEHRKAPLQDAEIPSLVRALNAWRDILTDLRLIGQDPKRYDGAGFGNLSVRLPPYERRRGARPFLVTGTQTGGRPVLEVADYAVVESYDVLLNTVRSRGSILPSSESMTHATIFDLSMDIRAVVHVHSPVIWRAAEALGLPTTAPHVDYGTPEMAHEVSRLHRETNLRRTRVLSMAGHEDGIIAFGDTLEDAAQAMLATLARALQVMRT
ncbi:MAG: class II aldolase/adducin family protein [Myxococcota bacterium]